jgi:hypothetical protein
MLFSKIELRELLWLLDSWDKNPREIWRLVLVVRLSTLAGHWEEIIHISSLCFMLAVGRSSQLVDRFQVWTVVHFSSCSCTHISAYMPVSSLI